MTLAQLKTFIVGVLKGWFTNKTVLDGLTEVEGVLYYKGNPVAGQSTPVTNEEVTQAVTDTITELNTEDTTEEEGA